MTSKRTTTATTTKRIPNLARLYSDEPTRNVNLCPACGGHVHNGQCIVCTAAWTQAQLSRGKF